MSEAERIEEAGMEEAGIEEARSEDTRMEEAGMVVDGRVTSKTRVFGVVGKPIGHSLSPQIHNTFARELGMERQFVYAAFEPDQDAVRDAFRGLFASGVGGVNVTMPYKGEAFAFADIRHREAESLTAANTLVRREDGVHAYNTDSGGFTRSFELQASRTLAGLRVLVLGAGASCRTLAHAAAGMGARRVAIASRSLERARSVAGWCAEAFPECEFAYVSYGNGGIYEAIAQSDVAINTTPVGMQAGADCGTPGGVAYRFKSWQCAVDLIYRPAETAFLQSARECGAMAINGLGMLVCQGALAFELFTGVRVPDALAEGLLASLRMM